VALLALNPLSDGTICPTSATLRFKGFRFANRSQNRVAQWARESGNDRRSNRGPAFDVRGDLGGPFKVLAQSVAIVKLPRGLLAIVGNNRVRDFPNRFNVRHGKPPELVNGVSIPQTALRRFRSGR
jgi:hypothetical protein